MNSPLDYYQNIELSPDAPRPGEPASATGDQVLAEVGDACLTRAAVQEAVHEAVTDAVQAAVTGAVAAAVAAAVSSVASDPQEAEIRFRQKYLGLGPVDTAKNPQALTDPESPLVEVPRLVTDAVGAVVVQPAAEPEDGKALEDATFLTDFWEEPVEPASDEPDLFEMPLPAQPDAPDADAAPEVEAEGVQDDAVKAEALEAEGVQDEVAEAEAVQDEADIDPGEGAQDDVESHDVAVVDAAEFAEVELTEVAEVESAEMLEAAEDLQAAEELAGTEAPEVQSPQAEDVPVAPVAASVAAPVTPAAPVAPVAEYISSPAPAPQAAPVAVDPPVAVSRLAPAAPEVAAPAPAAPAPVQAVGQEAQPVPSSAVGSKEPTLREPSQEQLLREEKTIQFVGFLVGTQMYAVPSIMIREVIRRQPLSRLPVDTRFVPGVINLRGLVIPLVSLRELLQAGPAEDGSHDQFSIITGSGGLCIGLAVDRIRSMYVIRQEDIVWNVSGLLGLDDETIIGLFELEERLVPILSVERVAATLLEEGLDLAGLS